MNRSVTILLILAAGVCRSQTTIQGTVRDKNGPLPFASVFLENSYDGATADDSGSFRFSTHVRGEAILLARMTGYKECVTNVQLEGKPITVEILLVEQITELNAVTISAGSFGASDESRRTIFRAVDIATTAGATADIAGALNTLPGTQKVGESGRLFVRGGDSYEGRTYIDGMLVPEPYSAGAPNAPSRGRFLPFMFKGISFSTGGYSAEYGQALSSVLAMESKDETAAGRTDIGILSVGGDVAHTHAWDGGSLAGKVQYTNLQPYMGLVRQNTDWVDPPSSAEAFTAFRQRLGKNGMIKAFGNISSSAFSLHLHPVGKEGLTDFYSLDNTYGYGNVAYKIPVNRRWLMRGGMSWSDVANDKRLNTAEVLEREKGLHVKHVMETSIADWAEARLGVEVIRRSHVQQIIPQHGTAEGAAFAETIGAAFMESDLYATSGFLTRAGLRLEHNNLTGKISADPRVSLAYRTGEASQVSFAFGRFRQMPKSEFLRSATWLKPETARHFILNYQVLRDNRTFRVEAYHKVYDGLVKFANRNPSTPLNSGSGYARGVELFWRDNGAVSNLDYWVSYSFLDTERDWLDFPRPSAPAFTSAHNASVVVKYFITDLKSQLGATVSYTSGRRYNDPNEPRFNAGMTPSFQDLSFNWAYLPKPWLILYVSCTNLLGRDNIFGYEFSEEPDTEGRFGQRPVRQPATRFVFAGVFITLSKDKSINQLPSL